MSKKRIETSQSRAKKALLEARLRRAEAAEKRAEIELERGKEESLVVDETVNELMESREYIRRYISEKNNQNGRQEVREEQIELAMSLQKDYKDTRINEKVIGELSASEISVAIEAGVRSWTQTKKPWEDKESFEECFEFGQEVSSSSPERDY